MYTQETCHVQCNAARLKLIKKSSTSWWWDAVYIHSYYIILIRQKVHLIWTEYYSEHNV